MTITICLTKLKEAVTLLKMKRDENSEAIRLIEDAIEELQETWGRSHKF